MATLPDRSVESTRDEHVSDHDELHRLHNILDGSSQPSTGGAGGGVASLGGAGVVTRGDQLNTLDVDGNPRNVLDSGNGSMTIRGVMHLGNGSEVESTDGEGNTRNRLDDGNGNASVSGDQQITGELLVGSIATIIGRTDAQGGIFQNGTTLGVPSTNGTTIFLDYHTPWGVAGDDDDGTPYYDPGNVSPGEEAILLPDLTLLRVGVPQ